MTTKVNDPKTPNPNGATTRLIGSIAKEPETKTSGRGNVYMKFPVLIDTGNGVSTFWSATVMENLAVKLPGFFSKWRYAKFVGLGTPNKEFTKKDGTKGTSNEILVTGIELQDGTFVQADKPEDKEDAPF